MVGYEALLSTGTPTTAC